MEKDPSGNRPIAMARQAIIESLRAQNSHDKIALISFDITPHLLLPLQHYTDPENVIKEKFIARANGGTLIKPALNAAFEEFAKTAAQNRILILVTDGFIDDKELTAAEALVKAEKTTVIVLAIDPKIEMLGLKRLTEFNNGRFLTIDSSAQLPLLMRKELDQRRTPIDQRVIKVQEIQPLPFLPELPNWPDLSSTAVTKAKKNSQVFLISDKGDPLLAAQHSGAGKVIALPAGLNQWANNWKKWEYWSTLIEGLIDWSSINTSPVNTEINVYKESDQFRLVIDAMTSKRQWNHSPSAALLVVDPLKQIKEQTIPATAPGHYTTVLNLEREGPHRVFIRIGDAKTQLHLFNESKEFVPTEPTSASTTIDKTVEAIQKHSMLKTLNSIASSGNTSIRKELLSIALVFYLILMILENNLLYSLVFASKPNTPKRAR